MARMSDPGMVTAIKAAVTIPVMAKARIGHFVEAQILEALDIDYIDESEVNRVAESRVVRTGIHRSGAHGCHGAPMAPCLARRPACTVVNMRV